MNCLAARDRLLDLAEGHLEPPDAAELRRHLAECAECDAAFRKLRALVGDLSAARSVERAAWSTRASGDQPGPQAPPSRIGDFELLGEIGRGGMGVVYRARQLSLNREVALKILAGLSTDDPRAVERFTKEAKAAARLHHTNIVPVYAQGCENGLFYYAMECIEGQSLDRVLREDRSFEKSAAAPADAATIQLTESAVHESAVALMLRARSAERDFRRIARLIAEVADALEHAHSHGIVHRDIKPQNLLLGADDRLQVTDFGLARILDEPGLTRTHEMLGTPAYMAPEQVRAGSKIDARTDVYALGVTLYELLTRERPFKAETYSQLIDCILNKEPRAPRALDARVPADLETICLRAMEKSPAARFASAGELARDLRRYADDFPIRSRRVSLPGRVARWIRRNPYRSATLLATLLLLLAGGVARVLWNSAANAKIERAFDVLLENSRNTEGARAALGWVASFGGGDGRRRALLTAFMDLRANPQAARESLERQRQQHPDDADVLALLAWVHARKLTFHEVDEARKCIDEIRSRGLALSADGYFFLGMARMAWDPEGAVEELGQATKARTNFVHAYLHQARAINQLMYYLRDLRYYSQAISALKTAQTFQAGVGPPYLMACCHRIAGEIYAASGRPAEAQRAFDEAIQAAQEAQRADPGDPLGILAEAQALESRGRFAAAIAAYQKMDRPEIRDAKRPADQARRRAMERSSYELRLHYALGRFEAADALAKSMRSIVDDPEVDVEVCLLRTLIALAAGGRDAAARVFREEMPRELPRSEMRIQIEAARRIVLPDAPALTTGQVTGPYPAGWSEDWTRRLIEYQRGAIEWSALECAARVGEGDTANRAITLPAEQQRMAGACFVDGMLRLAGGDEAGAGAAFAKGAIEYDDERYCFFCRMLAYRYAPDAFPHDAR